MHQSQRFTTEFKGEPVICHCGVKAPIVISTTDENPGRRFFGCKQCKQGNGCGFFLWHDEPLGDEQVKSFIIQLRDANMILRRENSKLKEENKALRHKLLRSQPSSEEDLVDEIYNEMLKTVTDEGKKLAEGKRFYKMLSIYIGLILLYMILGQGNNNVVADIKALP